MGKIENNTLTDEWTGFIDRINKEELWSVGWADRELITEYSNENAGWTLIWPD